MHVSSASRAFGRAEGNEKNNAERFIVAFATIERTLNAITRRPKYIPFRMNARISARYNTVVRNHLEEICSFAELRNCIVHTRDGKQKLVATPSDDTVEEIEHIAKLLLQDFNVLNFATAPVITGEYTEPLRDVLIRLKSYTYEHFAESIKPYLFENMKTSQRGKDALIYMAVPAIDFEGDFDAQTDKLNEVLESVVLLQEFMEEMDYGGMETILQDGPPAEEENL